MSGPARLPFLTDAPWRVAVVEPHRALRAQPGLAGMIEAGTPLVGGIALAAAAPTWTACRSTIALPNSRKSPTSP